MRRVWNIFSVAIGAIGDTIRGTIFDCVFFCPGYGWFWRLLVSLFPSVTYVFFSCDPVFPEEAGALSWCFVPFCLLPLCFCLSLYSRVVSCLSCPRVCVFFFHCQASDEEPIPLCPLLWPIARQVGVSSMRSVYIVFVVLLSAREVVCFRFESYVCHGIASW